MSWRNTDCIYEGLEHIVDAFKDNLPCKGHTWDTEGNNDFNKECHKCPLYHEDKWSEEEDSCYIRLTYDAIEKLDRREE